MVFHQEDGYTAVTVACQY